MTIYEKVEQWFIDRNLQDADPKKQVAKLVEEFGELTQGLIKGNNELVVDSIGDMTVVLVGLKLQTGLEIDFDELEDLGKTRPDVMFFWDKILYQINEINTHILSGKKYPLKVAIKIIVTKLKGLCNFLELDFNECLEIAYDEIKDRKGKLVDGVFVKESDLK